MRIKLMLLFAVLLTFISLSAYSASGIIKKAQKLYENKKYFACADLVNNTIQNKKIKNSAKMYVQLGKCLENATEEINTKAEKQCYRIKNAPKSPACMKRYALNLNKKYGKGSFKYTPSIVLITYTGIHYKLAGEKFPKSDAAAEADYRELTKNLIGKPDPVIQKIKQFLKRHPRGKWHKKGLLLLARINEDIWYLHKNWSWMLYGRTLSSNELIIKAEPYRQKALKLFKKVRGGKEGKIARREYKLLKKNKSDGKVYGIINESTIKGTKIKSGNNN